MWPGHEEKSVHAVEVIHFKQGKTPEGAFECQRLWIAASGISVGKFELRWIITNILFFSSPEEQ